jgi:hypothetical protein
MLITTEHSVYKLSSKNHLPEESLKDLNIRRVLQGQKNIIIALEDGSLLIQNGNRSIQKIQTNIKDRIDSLYLINENPISLLIGCTPPNLYIFNEDFGGVVTVSSFQKLPVRDKWFTPWGGPPAVRSIAGTKDGWIYADIHVGSIMRSRDNGENWEPVNPTLHRDVHEVVTCPSNNNMVYANTYRSVYISNDRGQTWYHRSGALNDRYGRGIAVHPTDPDLLLCGVSDGPRRDNVHGQLYRTEDRGMNWVHIDNGFPESTRSNIDTFHIRFNGDEVFVSDEQNLYHSNDQGKNFELFWSAPEKIVMIDSHF